MNSFEREVARSQLTAERHTLDELEEIYRQAADEICRKLEISNGKISVLLSEIENADEQTLSVLQSQIYQRNFKQSIKKQLDFLLKDLNDNQYASISEYLENCYNNGFIGTLYNFNMNDIPLNISIDPTLVVRAIHIESKLSKRLYDELGEDVEVLKRKVSATISRGIASNMHYNDIARNIASNSKTGLNRAMTITRTEGNRIYNAANLDCGKAAKEKGVDDVKQWDSTLDGNTRPHHRQLDGQVRELEEDFEVGSIKAPAPLQFGIPGEDINCRCICLVKPRWDVDSAFTKRDNASGELLEFEGVEDYEDFKRRYWKSVDKSEKGNVKKLSDNTFIPAKSIEEAEAYAKSIGVRHVDYSDLPVETANLLNEAVLTIPKEIRPAFLGSGNNIQKYSGAKFSRASKNYYGVKVEVTDMHFGEYPNIVYDFDGGHMVGISNYYKTADKITKSKLAGNKKYAEKYNGHTQFFNTDGRSTAFHEMGHVYADKIGIPQGFSDDVKRWYDECNCDMLKSVDEAWAEAWGAYHIQNKELPDYIAKYIEKATEKPLDKVNESGIIKVTTNAVGKEVKIVNRSELHDEPNAITQFVNKKGGIDRNYYDENGRQFKQISNNHHNHNAVKNYGNNGEHAHDYIYDENGKIIGRPYRELNAKERKENSDIL